MKNLYAPATCLFVTLAVGCSSGETTEPVSTSDDALSASQYLGTAGEWVVVTSAKLDPGILSIASLNDKGKGDPKSCAKTVRVGSCLAYQDCVPSSPSATRPRPADVTVVSGATTLTLTDAQRDFFDFADSPAPGLFPVGATVHASGAGIPGRVGAFSLDGTMPTAATVTSPSYASRVTVHRGRPFIATWTGANKLVSVSLASTEMKVTVGANGERGGVQAGPASSVECIFDGARGTGAIPAAALQYLPLGQGAPESVPLTAPAGTRYLNVNLEIASEGHSFNLGLGQEGLAVAELITRSSSDNTSNVDIVP